MAVTLWSAWAFAVAAVCLQPAQAQDKPADKCVFEGKARNSVTHLGVAKAVIHLVGQTVGYTGSSDAAGAFRFEGVKPGDYTVEANRTGYSADPLLADASGRAISSLHLGPGETISGSFWFTPEGSVSGSVTGPDGEPLRDALVTLFRREWRQGKRAYVARYSETADDQGRYHFAEVEPGGYVAYAARPRSGPLARTIRDAPGEPEMRVAGRYHPNTASIDRAAVVDVKGGQAAAGIDFKLPLVRVFHVTGKAEASSGTDFAWVKVSPQGNGQTLDWEGELAMSGADGRFDIAGVTPGDYVIYAFRSGERDRLSSIKLPLTVADKDLADVIVPPVQRFELKGRVRVDGQAGSGAIPVQIFCEGSDADAYSSMLRRVQPAEDGTFAIPDLTPDRYNLGITNMETGKDGGYYLKSVTVKGAPAAGAEVDMTGGPVEEVDVVLSPAVGSLEGTVRWPEKPDGVPELGEARAIIVPVSLNSGDSRTKIAFFDQNGHFGLSDLEPGRYRVFVATVTGSGWDLWQNPEFRKQIASLGAEVDVTESGKARAEAPLVRASEIRAIEERIQ